jgi:hypothetical protein
VLHAEKVKSEHILGRIMIAGMSTPARIDIGSSRHPQISIRSATFRVSISRSLFTWVSGPAVRRMTCKKRGSRRLGDAGNRQPRHSTWPKKLRTSKP